VTRQARVRGGTVYAVMDSDVNYRGNTTGQEVKVSEPRQLTQGEEMTLVNALAEKAGGGDLHDAPFVQGRHTLLVSNAS